MHKALFLLSLALLVSGCGYVVTYDDAFPPEPLNFPVWDPPDSIAFAQPEIPPVETVILDAELYYRLHPRVRPIILAPTVSKNPEPPVVDVEVAQSNAADSIAVADSLAQARSESILVAEDLPAVRVDLSNRLEQAYIARADRDLAAAKRLISLLGRLKLTREETAQLQAVDGFAVRAEKALLARDFEGASNLAFKARTLAESLVESQP